MDKQSQLAVELRAKIRAVMGEYRKHEHLAPFISSLRDVAVDIDASLEDTEDVE